MTALSKRIASLMASVSYGRVATYGQIASAAGNARAARAVAWVLCARDDLPWHRIGNTRGGVSLPRGGGHERQCALLLGEGIEIGTDERVDLSCYGAEAQSGE